MALPLSHLRLQAPPLRLLLGAMWRVAQQQAYEHYGILEECVVAATESVPDLLSIKEKTVLLLALRTKIFLSDPDPSHLDRSKVSPVTDGEWDRSMSSLKDAVSKGLDPETLREVFGCEFDAALESLLCHFLSRLQQLLPVPDFAKVSSMLQDDWLKDCLQEVKSQQLKEFLANHSSVHNPTCPAPESKPEVVLKSAWQQLLSLQRMNEVSKTTNKKQETLKPTNQKRNLTTCTNQKSLEPKPVLPTANQTTVVTLLNQNFAFPLVLKQTPYFLFPTKNTPLSKVTSHSSSVSIPTNHSSPVSVSTNHSSHVFIPTNHSSPGSIPTNRKPSKSKLSKPKKRKQISMTNQTHPGCEVEIVINQRTDQSQLTSAPTKDQPAPSSSAVTVQSDAASSEAPQDSLSQNPRRLPQKCPQCGKCFFYRNQVLKHLESNRTCSVASHPIRALHCFQCPASFQTKVELLTHLRTHRAQFPALGQSRPKTGTGPGPKNETGSKTGTGLKTGLRARTGDTQQGAVKEAVQERPSFSCCLCDERFKHQTLLLSHLDQHALKGEEPRYDCLHCEQSFTGSTLLRIHQRTHVPRPFVCDVCGRSYASEVALTAHTKLHGEKRFLCHTCGRGFVSRVALRSHVRTHTGERPYTCTLCGRGFAFNAGLKVHLRRHLGDKPYTCSVCGKGFPSGGDLQAHARTHTGEKPYVCRECGKRFVVSTQLRAHRRTHTGEKPCACPECGKKFSRNFELKRHLRLHFNVRPFQCPHCPKAYTCTNHLRRHLRTHQG
ncbi:zinc finger protein 432-like [Periophthalmus magnuspinnatus]|uniref:zinc finger protein 432-like n=1 Tax=Periophthalmus magnuspinnatus TaxID=409849 RepID=UPI00145AFBF5|nr:zinc finger protein 432-like [Periophthalmus magnuspinnatus]